MSRAGDASIVVADRLLALPLQRVPRCVHICLHKLPQVVFDGLLIL
jgi:hypothetical protein